MSVFAELSLVIASVLVATVVAGLVSDRISRFLSRLSLLFFRQAVEREGRRRRERTQNLRAIHSTTTYPVYAAKTLLYSIMLGMAGALGGVFFFDVAFRFISNAEEAIRSSLPSNLQFVVPPDLTLAELSWLQLFVLLLFSSATFGTLGAGLTYSIRWWIVSSRADQREVLIDESVARVIAFIYALSRSGMVYPEVMRTVGENRQAFGEAAQEVGVVVKDMDLFGADLVTALERIARHSPSEQFSDFAENFASVLRSGSNVTDYLRDQYDQYQSERISEQEQLLELFAALGEGYVAGLVAGPLFFLTLLVIFGILTGNEQILLVIQLIIYVLIPLANIGFIGYIGRISEPLSTYQAPVTQQFARRSLKVRRANQPDAAPQTDGGARPDGGQPMTGIPETNLRRLAIYNRLRWLRSTLLNPFRSAIRRPRLLLIITVPIGIVVAGIRLWEMLSAGAFSIRAADDIIIQSGLFVFATFAVFQELHTRRVKGINDAVPDFLDRLASTNEAGMTFTESLRRIERSDLGRLNDEVEKLLTDIEWGARTEKALYRFNDRIGSSTVARVVALITNAMMASGKLGPVVRIAAEEAREDRRLRVSRRQEMFMYTLIIYLSFFVFLGIAVALQQVLLPAIPSPEEIGAIGGGPAGVGPSIDLPINPAEGALKDKFVLALYHSTVIQGLVSGLVAGQMGEGSVADGAKHVTVLLAFSYLTSFIIG